MKVLPSLLAFAWALILCPISLLAEDIKTYQATYEKQLEAITDDHLSKMLLLNTQYERGVNALKPKFQKEGNLDKMKVALAEVERFKNEQAMPESVSTLGLKEILNLQKIYAEHGLLLKVRASRSLITLSEQYDRALANYQKMLFQSGKFDEALAVEEERKRVKQSESFLAAKTVLTVSDLRAVKIFRGHRYKVFTEKTSWHDARDKCKELGGHLVIINDEQENNFVVQLMREAAAASGEFEGTFVFAGASDEAKEKQWIWVDGSPVNFSLWMKGQPNNGGNPLGGAGNIRRKYRAEHYLVLSSRGDWNDVPKSYLSTFICEWK